MDKYLAIPPYIKSGSISAPTSSGGEGGIRTRVPLRETRSPGVRVRPDYATSPNLPDRLPPG